MALHRMVKGDYLSGGRQSRTLGRVHRLSTRQGSMAMDRGLKKVRSETLLCTLSRTRCTTVHERDIL